MYRQLNEWNARGIAIFERRDAGECSCEFFDDRDPYCSVHG